MVDTAASNKAASQIYHLIKNARQWLLTAQPREYGRLGLTISIYWAIRSLEVFYNAQISQAVAGGAPNLQDIHEEEWPDEPEGEDSWDISGIPEWLSYILTLDHLHVYGLTDITTRRAPRTRHRKIRWFPPAHLHIEIIPQRELDDPPDSDEETDSFCDLIVELSGIELEMSTNNLEDNTSR